MKIDKFYDYIEGIARQTYIVQIKLKYDWSNNGKVIVLHGKTKVDYVINGDIYLINGSFMDKLYLIDSINDRKQTSLDARLNRIVPKSVLIIDDKLGETYKYY